jgi:Asp-tRNA(Asn)/Glu-tRNA(Gln) amidotransferase A subunit family amidase
VNLKARIVERASFKVAGDVTSIRRGTERPALFGRVWNDFETRRRVPNNTPYPEGCEVRTVPGGTFAVFEIQYGDMAGFDQVMPNVQLQFTAPADFAGTPTISLPCGETEDGAPYTIQFMGGHPTEPMLCRIAHAHEQTTEWHTRHPQV